MVCNAKIMAELAESRDTYMQEGDDANIHEVGLFCLELWQG